LNVYRFDSYLARYVWNTIRIHTALQVKWSLKVSDQRVK
jgi:hypothetical protein